MNDAADEPEGAELAIRPNCSANFGETAAKRLLLRL
jgi:hypothetical protein